MKNNLQHSQLLHGLLAMSALLCLMGAAPIADPTRPPDNLIAANKSGKASGGPELTAIFISPKGNYALIDGHPAFIGDPVGAYTIINIQHDAVELSGAQNEKIVLELLPTVKQVGTVTKGR